MTKQEAIRTVCQIIGLVYHSFKDYSKACDCFCDQQNRTMGSFQFQCERPDIFDYIRQAVLERLKREGHEIHEDFDPETGKVKEAVEDLIAEPPKLQEEVDGIIQKLRSAHDPEGVVVVVIRGKDDPEMLKDILKKLDGPPF